jgi:hypothetical protein
MSILDKARAGQNFLEQIANFIPGFKGYREKELRRDADRVEREHVAARLEECKKPLNDTAAALTRSGGLEAINAVETARKRLDKVIARVRYADRGYAGFFDTIKVDEEALARVYEFDLSLIQQAEAAQKAAGQGKLEEFLAVIDAMDARMADRESILSGIR